MTMKIPALLAAALFALAGVTGSSSAAAPRETVVVLPFMNVSGVEGAASELSGLFVRRIGELGYQAAPAEAVEAFLAAERVRYLDSLTAPLREKLLAASSASAVVFGSVYAFAQGDNPIVGLSARMVRADGSVAWAGISGMSSQDTEGALGVRQVTSVAALAEKAVEKLLHDFPAPGAAARLASARAKPIGVAAPVTFRSPALEAGHKHRICLLPLENRSESRIASRVLGELLAQRLAASETFTVVEPADFRQAMIAAVARGWKSGDPAELAKLSPALQTGLFLRGTVYVFRDTSPQNSSITPELELDLALVDASAGRLLWTSRIARKGRDYEKLFRRGAITNIVSLADQAAAEMVRAAEKARPGSPARLASRRHP
jgi:TolB-like protein